MKSIILVFAGVLAILLAAPPVMHYYAYWVEYWRPFQ